MPHHKAESGHFGRRPSVFDRLGPKSSASRSSAISRRSRTTKINTDVSRRRAPRFSSSSSDGSSSSSGSSVSDSVSSTSSGSPVSARSSSGDSRIEDRKRRKHFRSKEHNKSVSRLHRPSLGSDSASSGLKRRSDSDSRTMSSARRPELHKSQTVLEEDVSSCRDRRYAASSHRKNMKYFHSMSDRSFQRSRSRERRSSPSSIPSTRCSRSPIGSRRSTDVRSHRLTPLSLNAADSFLAGKRRYTNSRDTSHRHNRRSEARVCGETSSSSSRPWRSPPEGGDRGFSRATVDSDDTDQPDPSDMIIRDEVRCDDAVSDVESIASVDNQRAEGCGWRQHDESSTVSAPCDAGHLSDHQKTTDVQPADISSANVAQKNSSRSIIRDEGGSKSKTSIGASTSDDMLTLKTDSAKFTDTSQSNVASLPVDSFSDFSDDADEILNREDDEPFNGGSGAVDAAKPICVERETESLPSQVDCTLPNADVKDSTNTADVLTADSEYISVHKEGDWPSVDWNSLMADSLSSPPHVQSSASDARPRDESGSAAVESGTAASAAGFGAERGCTIISVTPTSLLKALGVCREWMSSAGLDRLRQHFPGDENWSPNVSIATIAEPASSRSCLLRSFDPPCLSYR